MTNGTPANNTKDIINKLIEKLINGYNGLPSQINDNVLKTELKELIREAIESAARRNQILNIDNNKLNNILEKYGEIINEIRNKIRENRQEVDIRNKIEEIVSVLENIFNIQSQCNVDFRGSIRISDCSDDFGKVVGTLKGIPRSVRIDNRGDCSKVSNAFKNLTFLFDTCYNCEKAKRLGKALKAIRGALGNDDDKFKHFLNLLGYVLARSVNKYDFFLKQEWFLLLVRSVADVTKDRGKFIPVCPTKGDVAALYVYYYMLFGGSTGAGGGDGS